jgi:CheY-like chemotaxis protein
MPCSHDVLIVDDDSDMLDAVRAVLGRNGYECREATNGQQALELIADAKPALVLLDMQMPVMNGWECARKLRKSYGRGLPIVVVTAARHSATRRDEADADGVLPKPFAIEQLLRVVGRYAMTHVLPRPLTI